MAPVVRVRGTGRTVDNNIDKADAVVVVTGYDVVYDGNAHTATGTATGADSSDLSSLLDLSGTTHTNAGDYNGDVWSFAGDANHNPANGTVDNNIDKALASVTANPKTKTYGDMNPALDAVVVGQVVGGDVIHYSLSTTATQFSSVAGSPYPIVVTLGSNPNYSMSSTDSTLTVDAKVATVTANNKTKNYGALNPTVDAVVVGEVAGGDVINYTLATTATQFSPIGDYPITVTLGSNPNHSVTKTDGTLTITAGFNFFGFHSPIGGSVENTPSNGGSFLNPVRSFKLKSTIPVKFSATWITGGAPLLTGIHTLQATKYSNATTVVGEIVDATPTDSATTGNQFRLTDGQWHFNLSTKTGFSEGTWLLKATLVDGSTHTVWITIKK